MSGKIRYELTGHAIQVMAEREIPVEWVERVLAQPEITEPDGVDPELRHALGRVPERGVTGSCAWSTMKPESLGGW